MASVRGNSSVIIGIVDTGVDIAHPDLSYNYTTSAWGNKILVGHNFADDRSPSDVTDGWGHGTGMAGLAAARTGTGVSVPSPDRGIAGVAGGWGATSLDSAGARILPVRTSDDVDFFYSSWVTGGINWAVMKGARVINMSFGDSPGEDPATADPLMREALYNAVKMGVTCVAAMGNDNNSLVYYPARFAEWGLCIAVGSTDLCGLRADLGSIGSNYGPHIDLVAPGTMVVATHPAAGGNIDFGADHYYREVPFGTSNSAALVSGVSASLLGLNPGLRDVDIKNILRLSAANPNSETVPNQFIGAGRVDFAKAASLLDPAAHMSLIGGTVGPTQFIGPTATMLEVKSTDELELDDGTYNVDKYEVRFAVTFPVTFEMNPPPSAWVHVVGTKGWSPPSVSPHLFNYGWGELMPNTLSTTGATFRTYVYFVKDGVNRWVPNMQSEATLSYAVVGKVAGLVGVGEHGVAKGLSVRVLKNPEGGSQALKFELGGHPKTAVRVLVCDVAGRRQLDTATTLESDGRTVVIWDGRDERGGKVPAGVYFVRVSQAGKVATTKAVLLQ